MNIKARGVILKEQDFKEADKILTIYTKELGKITALAKGVRKTKSKLAGNLQQFSEIELYLAPGKSFYIVCGAETKERFLNIKKDLSKIADAFYISELVDKFTTDGQSNVKIFQLLYYAFSRFDKNTKNKDLFLAAFELKLLEYLGYKPQTKSCVQCQNNLGQNEKVFFNVRLGGVLCPNCQTHKDSFPIDRSTAKIINLIFQNKFDTIVAIKNLGNFLPEIKNLNHKFLVYAAEKDFKSLKFIEAVESLKA